MGAFLNEMKGVKLRKVSTEAIKKEKELVRKGKEREGDEITAVLRESFLLSSHDLLA